MRGDNPKEAARAAVAILDRAIGKPVQPIAAALEAPEQPTPLTAEEMRARLRDLLAAKGLQIVPVDPSPLDREQSS
jgi:hypothetical protein